MFIKNAKHLINKIFLNYFKKPFYIEKMQKYLISTGFVLDVGCGNHAPSKFKRYFPEIQYLGVDRSLSYNLDDDDFSLMNKFFKINLDNLSELKMLPNNYFDCILVVHVIEHLRHPLDVIKGLIKKLKKGGFLYLEYPSQKSAFLPRMRPPFFQSSLNFHDDPSHICVPDTMKIVSLINESDCRTLQYGARRSWKRIMLLPLYLINSIYCFHKIDGGVFWDVLGFADYIVSVKNA